MLRALESTGIFTQTSPRVFANTPQSECLRRHSPGSQWAWIRICLCPDSFVEDGWSGLLLAVKNGKTGYDQVRGQSAWEFMQSNPEQHTNFNSAMRDLSASMTPAVTASYGWSKFAVIADIGGGDRISVVQYPGCASLRARHSLRSAVRGRGSPSARPHGTSGRRLLHQNPGAGRRLPYVVGHPRLGGRPRRLPFSRMCERPHRPTRGLCLSNGSSPRRPRSIQASGWMSTCL